jgi:hypothetical protein
MPTIKNQKSYKCLRDATREHKMSTIKRIWAFLISTVQEPGSILKVNHHDVDGVDLSTIS